MVLSVATIFEGSRIIPSLQAAEVAWFALICLAIVLGAKYFVGTKKFGRFPPGPRGLPLVGNIFDLKRLVRDTKFHYRAWSRLAELYGPVVGIRLGFSDPMIIVSGKEAVTEMLNREEFDGRPDGFLFRHRTFGARRGIIFTDGTTWKEQRRFSLKNLRDFGFGRKTMEDIILNEAVTLARIIEEKSNDGPIRNVDRIATVAVLNSLWYLTANTRYDQEKEDAGLAEIVQIISDIFKDSDVSGGVLNYFPFLRYIVPGLSGYKSRNDRQMRVWHFFRNLVDQHKTSVNFHHGHRDLIDAYLSEIELQKFNSSSSFNELQLIALLKDLFTAGIETTNNSIGFVLLYLIANPYVQQKIHEEIDRVLGRNALPSIQTRSRMPYLNATVMEVSRLANVGPTTIPHRATADAKFMGFDIKKNYILLANLHSIHMDRGHWGDPKTFRPERFLDENGHLVKDPWMITFGAGRRKCPGENLAKNSQFLFLCCLLQKLRFELPPGEAAPCLDGINGFTISPPNFNAVAVAR
ncbi:methyl farnesoate epoxidase [Neodiprion pinetum]|uniref:Methyl farnesoate epoxidase-like n=1 Tax=Neodiprion lecontei TaxID=441921 RepID=A0A6J0BSJ6_NEOLC|nr:methyl farnesoate epoxidase-like [Neodiprion lecontei]XP_046467340.1 methyl farnesoate epoxidase-like [Neodiprion pinetum]